MARPLSDQAYEQLMRRARETNHTRDGWERDAGFAAPMDSDPFLYLRTAESAIEAGVRGRDWNCVAEGLAMLQDISELYLPLLRLQLGRLARRKGQ